jgi:methyltransferase (TIGR00027 family)
MLTRALSYASALLLTVAPAAALDPTNDVTLYVRALYQDCEDSNGDYLAVDFLEGTEQAIASHAATRTAARTALATVSDHNVVYFSSRTNYIDGKIAAWVENEEDEEAVTQVVSVAAGFDSRAYRLPSVSGVDFFELDMPAVMADKQKRVKAANMTCVSKSCTYVGADLRNVTVADALKSEPRFDPDAKTVYVIEGLIYYLHQDDVDTLFKSLADVASTGSKVIFDFTDHCIITSTCPDIYPALTKIFLEILHVKKEPWYSGFANGTVIPYMENYGFDTTELLSFQDARSPPLNVKSYEGSTLFGKMRFMTMERK